MSIFYEGMTLKWYSYVTVLLLVTDGFFFLATILNILFNRKNKLVFRLNIFSVILIIVMMVLKFLKIEHPHWAVTLWYFYILYFYGIQVITNILKYIHLNTKFVIKR
jgi:hypothetical protein